MLVLVSEAAYMKHHASLLPVIKPRLLKYDEELCNWLQGSYRGRMSVRDSLQYLDD